MNKSKGVLTIDFDGCIVEHDFPKIGKPLFAAFEVLKELQNNGYKLILWTCRENVDCKVSQQYLTEAVEFCRINGVEFDAVNETLEEYDFRSDYDCKKRKPHATWYIDDRNVGGFIGWPEIRRLLIKSEEYAIDLARRTCVACGNEKPITEFVKDKHKKSGYKGQCKLCLSNGRKIRFEPVLELDECKSSYIAGLIDGEGWIGLSKTKKTTKGGRSVYEPAIEIGMTNINLCNVFDPLKIGHKSYKHSKKKKEKSVFYYKFSANDSRALLRCISKYLVIKRRQAELLTEYLLSVVIKPPDLWTRAEEIYQELRILNKRGQRRA